ncbi:hypothetical protein J5N97_030056 [Dioscorea zingiberensis]|uniref:histidine kinase n=1 Tax=Dioscorea zingiberensis TaxID=325984 RepID=A0A9D5BWZ0_9LILI|nr:hypothetical protein J5N97_030056 [Dioscorea zingiberensis]
MEFLPSMWPDDLGEETRTQFNIEKPGKDHDMLEDVTIVEEPTIVDFKRLLELTDYSEKGSSQLAYLVKHWEYKQANAVRLLNEELNNLSKQRQEVELKKLEIIEQHRFEEEKYASDKHSISILEDIYDVWGRVPRRKSDVFAYKLDIDAEYDTVTYWKQRAKQLEKMLEESIQRERNLMAKLQETIKNLETQSSPVEELSQILKRADNFLHFVLQNAPVVIGHQDKELRYRFIYNHFPSLDEEDIIGKTDIEIFSGAGVDEIQNFKREVLERGLPAKREITFETALFGLKTFFIYVEPVFSKAGDKIGVNYMGMDVTDQVKKREKMAKLREEIAVQKAKETELNKTIHITEETMRAKQMLATMSHEIRSPLAGVVSIAEILANTKLDKDQRQLLDVMLSSGDLVLQLINDILDLSKVESGVMKLEATKFRPREVVRHVLQTAAASLQKELTLEGHVMDNVPLEVIGDVLRIRQILTNLISNAIKFTHEGKVGINLRVVSEDSEKYSGSGEHHQVNKVDSSALSATRSTVEPLLDSESYEDAENNQPQEKTVWLLCDVYDTGIGIPEKALPTLFKKYMQASADHARKYGGTGLGLAICKQLVELMGGTLTVTSQERHGSTFTFVFPCKVWSKQEDSGDSDEASIPDHELMPDANNEEINGSFLFKPCALGTQFSSSRSMVRKTKMFHSSTFVPLNSLSASQQESDLLSSIDCSTRDLASGECVSAVSDSPQTVLELGGLIQNSLEHNIHSIESIKRKDERFEGDSSPGNHSTNFWKSQKCEMPSKWVANMADVTEIGELRLANNRPMHNEENENPQSISNGICELTKINTPPRILLVEDNKINIMVAQSMMKQLGHKMDVVNNGLEAIRAFQHSHYDLILMDVCMPVMDGLQATRLIRSFEENGYWDASVRNELDDANLHSNLPSGLDSRWGKTRTPIIAMTANALTESVDDCLATGMDSFAYVKQGLIVD